MSKKGRLLSRVLRHEPELAEITLEPGGWVAVSDLLRGLKRNGHDITRRELFDIVETNDKQRFTLSKDGQRIRAAQGHSVAVDLQLPASEPPDCLYHGTATHSLDAIFREGLIPGRRRHVHLSLDEETAGKVGARHGKAIVLQVNTAGLRSAGQEFWVADNGVWLTGPVAPEFLKIQPC